MPGVGVFMLPILGAVLLIYLVYRLGYRVGKAESKLRARDDTDEKRSA